MKHDGHYMCAAMLLSLTNIFEYSFVNKKNIRYEEIHVRFSPIHGHAFLHGRRNSPVEQEVRAAECTSSEVRRHGGSAEVLEQLPVTLSSKQLTSQ